MGNLVFQATLGGQVNLVGPNTASTFNLNVPAIAGTLVTTGDTGTVTNTMLAGSIANAKLLNSSVTIGSTAVSLGSTVTAFAGITTLSMSGNLTLSGGTANGVAYLNGSNVLTTGSALTFDGTNLGVGVTPSAWTAGGKNIEVGSAGNIIQGQASQLAVIQNATFNSGWKYSANGLASFYNQTAGTHVWFTAPSGTAGNAITFTQALTLDANGNLGVGTTSPSASAILDAQSTTKGVRMPNMTTTQKNAISSPAAGLMVFDTTLAKLCVYSGSAWQTITSI